MFLSVLMLMIILVYWLFTNFYLLNCLLQYNFKDYRSIYNKWILWSVLYNNQRKLIVLINYQFLLIIENLSFCLFLINWLIEITLYNTLLRLYVCKLPFTFNQISMKLTFIDNSAKINLPFSLSLTLLKLSAIIDVIIYMNFTYPMKNSEFEASLINKGVVIYFSCIDSLSTF